MPHRSIRRSTPAMLTMLAAALCVLVGCSGGAGRIGTVDIERMNHEGFAEVGYRIEWVGFAEMGRRGTVRFFDAFDDVLVVHDSTNVISVLDTSTGERRWSDQVAGRLTRFVGNARSGGQLLVSSEAELFVYDLETSTLTDKQLLRHTVNTKPAVYDGVLVYGSTNGYVIGHLLGSGFTAWVNSFRDGGSISATPLIVGDAVGLISASGEVMFADPTASGSSLGRGKMFEGTSGDPTTHEGNLIVASNDHSIYCFASRNGNQVWRVRTGAPVNATPFVDGDLVCCTIEGDRMVGYDAATGDERWATPGITGTVVGARDGNLLVWNDDLLTALDREDGTIVSSVEIGRVATVVMSGTNDGDLYIVNDRGGVAKMTPTN